MSKLATACRARVDQSLRSKDRHTTISRRNLLTDVGLSWSNHDYIPSRAIFPDKFVIASRCIGLEHSVATYSHVSG